MTRKIIIYNSFVSKAQDELRRGGSVDTHVGLLRTQLSEVERELRFAPTHKHKALDNERKLIKRRLGAMDANESYWSYKAASETPSLEEAIKLGAISPNTTEKQWYQLSPGMRREIVRSKQKKQKKPQDAMGTPEEIAYGKGWQEKGMQNPYDDPKLAKEWLRGRQDAETAYKMRGNYRKGELRNKGFIPPKSRDIFGTGVRYKGSRIRYKGGSKVQYKGDIWIVAKNDGQDMLIERISLGGRIERKAVLQSEVEVAIQYDKSRDFKSEKGYVGKIVNSQTGSVMARSEPFISQKSAANWLRDKASEFVRSGKRGFKGEIALVFFDPDFV